MPEPAWSPAWCPGCSALVVQWVVALVPPPERHSWLESDYLVCPRCEAVTVSLPACTPVRAYTSLVAIGRTEWSQAELVELQRGVGRAKTFGPDRSAESVAAVTAVAPALAPVLEEALEAGQLPNALLTLGVLLDMLRSAVRSRPRPRSRAAETEQVGGLVEELRHSLAGVLAQHHDLAALEASSGAHPGEDARPPEAEPSR